MEDDSTGSNLIEGNFIGTDVIGTLPLRNGYAGVWVDDTDGGDMIGGTTAGAGNLISGNGSAGVQDFGSGNNLIEGNDIGTDVTGAGPLGNGGPGVQIYTGGDTLGGTTEGAGNLISGNAGVGVDTAYGYATLIEGNKIGTDVTGTYPVGNTGTASALVRPTPSAEQPPAPAISSRATALTAFCSLTMPAAATWSRGITSARMLPALNRWETLAAA